MASIFSNISKNPDESITNILDIQSGEQILWEDADSADKIKKDSIPLIFFSIVFMVFPTLLAIFINKANNTNDFRVYIFSAIFIAMGMILLVSVIKQIKNPPITHYIITNLRVIKKTTKEYSACKLEEITGPRMLSIDKKYGTASICGNEKIEVYRERDSDGVDHIKRHSTAEFYMGNVETPERTFKALINAQKARLEELGLPVPDYRLIESQQSDTDERRGELG